MCSRDVVQETNKPWFELHRAPLVALCYRLLGSISDAEDIVQETLLRASTLPAEELGNPRAYLMRVATNLCLDQLRSLRAKREVYTGTWLPEPVIDDALHVESPSVYAGDISYALMLTLEALNPPERAAFVLHEVFEAGYSELATILERNEAACRQLVARAKSRLSHLSARFVPTATQVQRVFAAFAQSTRTGDASHIEAVLCEDAILYTDGGGKVKAALQPIVGPDRIARFFVGVASKWPPSPPVTAVTCQVNGLPGLVVRHGAEPYPTVLCFEWSPDGVARVYSVRNPDKTRHVAS